MPMSRRRPRRAIVLGGAQWLGSRGHPRYTLYLTYIDMHKRYIYDTYSISARCGHEQRACATKRTRQQRRLAHTLRQLWNGPRHSKSKTRKRDTRRRRLSLRRLAYNVHDCTHTSELLGLFVVDDDVPFSRRSFGVRFL